MPSNATSILNISANGTYTGDAMPMKDTLPRSIFACESDNPHTSKQHVDGTYSASEGLIIFHVVNYLVNDLKQLINNDEGSLDGSYAVSSTALIFTLDLGHGERWKATFSK